MQMHILSIFGIHAYFEEFQCLNELFSDFLLQKPYILYFANMENQISCGISKKFVFQLFSFYLLIKIFNRYNKKCIF